jgi:cytochrome P450
MSESELPITQDQIHAGDGNPDPWAQAGQLGPVRRINHFGLAAWLVTRFDEVQAALLDPRLSSDQDNASEEARSVLWLSMARQVGMGDMMIFRDPPAHDRLRRLVSRAFTPRRVEDLRPRVQEITNELLDAIGPRGRADIVNDFSFPLAISVIGELIGVQLEDTDQFKHYAGVVVSTDPAVQQGIPAAMNWIRDYILALVENKQREPGPDLLSALIAVRDEGDRFSHAELGSMMLLLLFAGHDTTANLIGTGLLTLLNNPDQLAALRAEPTLIPAAVEEMLRYESTLAVPLPRYATDDLTIGGVHIAKRDTVLISLLAAGRDPARYSAPNTFDVHRADAGHLSFALGVHYCLGAALARMEAQIAFATLLSRLDNLALAVPPAGLTWRAHPNVRGFNHLPVTFTPTGSG